VPRYDTVSFLSDYGLVDEFVGVVKSVVRSIAPDVEIIDVTHDIAVHDVRAGALALARSAQYLVPGVVLAVVDPGVGSDRRRVAVEVGDGTSVLVGPDNGLLAPAVALVGGATRAVELTSPEHRLPAPGATFDGRDVFAPAAAHLCTGVALTALGPEIDPATLRPGVIGVPQLDGDGLAVEVLWVDRFGNVQLNVGPEDLDVLPGTADRIGAVIEGRSRSARRVSAYAELTPGELGFAVDSYGLLALVLDQRSAAAELGLTAGQAVTLRALEGDAAPAGSSTSVELRERHRP